MDHLPYIVASYGIALALALWLSIGATVRARRATRRLAAVDPRANRRRP